MPRLDDFLGCFFNDDETVHIRALNAKGWTGEQTPKAFTFTREQIRTNEFIQMDMKDCNETHGMYFVVNHGGFKNEEIQRFNAIFCEMDDRPIADQHKAYDLNLQPSIRIETRKSVHAYWLLGEPIKQAEWKTLQAGLIDKFKSDAAIKNEARLMRLPFFNHVTANGIQLEAVRCGLHTFTDTRYSLSDLQESFPFTQPTPDKPVFVRKEYNDDTQEGIAHELRYRITQLPTYKELPGGKGEAAGFCHGGQQSKSALFVNHRTGAVHCNGGCKFWEIAASFGLDRPARGGLRMMPRRQATSATARFLREHI